MSTYLKIDGNPDEVRGTGALIKVQAEAFAGKDLTKTGDGVVLAMTGYQSNDATSASDISRVKDL